MSEEIVKYWSNKNFAKETKDIIKNLLQLSKKYETNKLKFNEEISETMYEMF